MRMLKKIAAGAMAVALSLSMLTACGNSSGSVSATAAFEKLVKQVSAGKYYLEDEATQTYSNGESYTYSNIIAANGEMVYTKYIESDGTINQRWEDKTYDYWILDTDDEDEKIIIKDPKEEKYVGTLSSIFDEEELASNTQTTGTKTIDGVEYSCVTVTNEKEESSISFCFDKNGNFKYVVSEWTNNGIKGNGSKRELVIKIVKFTTSVSDSYFEFPDGYEVMTWEEYREYRGY